MIVDDISDLSEKGELKIEGRLEPALVQWYVDKDNAIDIPSPVYPGERCRPARRVGASGYIMLARNPALPAKNRCSGEFPVSALR